MRSALYNERALTWTVHGFTSPAESQALAGKVIEMISHFKGTRDEIGKLNGYLRQKHRYTIAQENGINALWGLFEAQKRRK